MEAKKSCPNAANRYDSEEKEQKFEEYYSSITEKFAASLQIYLAGPLAELKARMLQIRKIWGVEVAVLNEELAGQYKLTC